MKLTLPPSTVGVLCVSFSILVWGMNSVVMRLAVRDGLTASEMTVLRYVTAALLLAFFALRRPHFPVGRIGWARALALFAFAGVPYNMVLVIGVRYAPALDISAIVFGAIPITTAVLAYFVTGERLSPAKAKGLALVLAGILPFAVQAVADGLLEGSDAWKGHLLFIVAGALWGGFTVFSKRWRLDPWEVTAAVSILSALSTPLWLRTSYEHLQAVGTGNLVFFALYMGVVVAIVSLMTYQRAVRDLGPMTAGMAVALVPFVTWIGGEVALGEVPRLSQLAGTFLVMAGLAVASRASAAPATAGPAAVAQRT